MANDLGTPAIADGQADGQWQTSNDADAWIGNALADILTVDFSAGNVTLTNTQFRSAMTFVPSGLSTTRSLTVPALKRALFLVNNTDATDTINVVRGSTSIAVAAGKIGIFNTDGTTNGLVGAILVTATSGSNAEPSDRVRVATTANITIATALNNGGTLNGVTLVTGDLILVKDQTSAAENGIYVVGASPSRSSNYDAYDEHPGALIAVEEGTASADTLWLCTSNRGGTLNTTAIAFSQFSSLPGTALRSDAAANLTAGYTSTAYNAGTKSSGTFTPDPANGNLQRAVNGGAHTLAPPSVGAGDAASVVIQYTNNGSAGAITTSGFTKVTGSFTTTNGDDFMCYCTVVNGFSHLIIQALQ